MTVYTCLPEFDAMLTCIYMAWASGLGHKNIRLELEPLGQYGLWEEYVHVEAEDDKVNKVIDSVNRKISAGFFREISMCLMGYEEDRLDTVYRALILGFAYGPDALNMFQYRDIARLQAINIRVRNESSQFRERLRFHQVRNHLYVSHIEPKSRILITLGHPYSDRMPSENWMIVDDVHKEALIHPKDENFYVQQLTDEELEGLLRTEEENDEFTDLWKLFFDTIAIKERENARCQRNHFPIWVRKHAVEFT